MLTRNFGLAAALLLVCLLLVTSLTPFNKQQQLFVSADSAGECIGCILIFRSIEIYVNSKEQSIEKSLNEWCGFLPNEFSSICKLIVKWEGKNLIEALENQETPDVICRQLNICEKFKQCTLFPSNSFRSKLSPQFKQFKLTKRNINTNNNKQSNWWMDLIRKVIAPFYNTFDKHTPLLDLDNDTHSPSSTFGFRGFAWRGQDCNDNDNTIYPGRFKNRYQSTNPNIDHNCNGIYGQDPITKKNYEDLYCNFNSSGIVNRGVAVLGDSVSAHFRIPPQFLEPKYMNGNTFKHLFNILDLEVDWPMLSWGTAFYNDTYSFLTPGPSNSIYKYMWKNNRCIHRDYVNIAVNGARTGAMTDIIKTFRRDQVNDNPMLVFYSLVGNDVCHPAHDFDRYTTPEQFEQNVVTAMNYLDTILPNNSYVIFIGLAQGGFLYQTLQNETHPLGIKYPHFYDYLNCMEVNPCWGWMNSNETIRDITSKHAALLSTVYDKVIRKYSFKNFKMIYHDFPLFEILNVWINKYNGQLKDLIEPFDGFHLSQPGQSLMADVIWEWLLKEHREVIGEENPFNGMIQQKFGQQGGY
ncbi:hypothetical protein ABK040_009953 [Willaertia magna]